MEAVVEAAGECLQSILWMLLTDSRVLLDQSSSTSIDRTYLPPLLCNHLRKKVNRNSADSL